VGSYVIGYECENYTNTGLAHCSMVETGGLGTFINTKFTDFYFLYFYWPALNIK